MLKLMKIVHGPRSGIISQSFILNITAIAGQVEKHICLIMSTSLLSLLTYFYVYLTSYDLIVDLLPSLSDLV